MQNLLYNALIFQISIVRMTSRLSMLAESMLLLRGSGKTLLKIRVCLTIHIVRI